MPIRMPRLRRLHWLLLLVPIFLLVQSCDASIGDRLPEFQECVKVCEDANCGNKRTSMPFYLRLMLWTCPRECDQICQHVITSQRLLRDPPMNNPVVQFHGKWPFHRLFGMQEPFSVFFSLLNYLAHQNGIAKIRESVPPSYALRPYYLGFGYFGLVSWVFSMIFHARDFSITEKLDYYAAGASVFYGLYYTPVRVFRLERPKKEKLLTIWTWTCLALYTAHVSYLTFWRWDYAYNMAANVAAGFLQNLLWSWFSITRYRKMHKVWAAWPGLIVAWIVMAMSLELLDFPPVGGLIDAHSLWHLGTVLPTYWWYNFLIRDAKEDMAGERLKA